MKLTLLLTLCMALCLPCCLAEEAPDALLPLVQYDFSDADDLGRDVYGLQPMANIGGVTQGDRR